MLSLDGQRLSRAGLFEGLVVVKRQGYLLARLYWLSHQFSAITHRQYSRVIRASLCRIVDLDILNFQRQRPWIFKHHIPGVVMNQLSSVSLQTVFKVCPVDINSEVLGVPSVERLSDLKSQVWLIQDCFHFLLILFWQSLLFKQRAMSVRLVGKE